MKISKEITNALEDCIEKSSGIEICSNDNGTGKRYIIGNDGRLVRIESTSNNSNSIQIGEGETKTDIPLSGSFTFVDHGTSGFSLEGDAINKNVFEKVVNNTSCEWGLSLKSGGVEPGGLLGTSFGQHEVDTNIVTKNGYDTYYHNHGHGKSGEDMSKIYSHPSLSDLGMIEDLEAMGYKKFYIFSEVDYYMNEGYYYYNSKTTSLESTAIDLEYDIENNN